MNTKDKILKIFEGNPLYENFRLGYWRMRTRKSQKELEENAKKRANGFDDRQFSRLKEFENKYNGERCFIIATGPSLTIDDLEKLKDEYTFGVNSIIKLFDETDFRPDFYGIQDKFVYGAMQDVIKSTKFKTAFCADIIAKEYEVPSDFIPFPYNGEYHLYNGKPGEYNAKFSDNAMKLFMTVIQ